MAEVRRSRTVPCLVLLLAGGPLLAGEPWGHGDNDILFSEVHYHPAGDEETQEFIELHNAGVRWVDLGGWTFTSGIEFTFPQGTVLEPGGYLVVARNAAQLKASRKAANVLGDWKGSLKNSGDILELRNRTGRCVAVLHYRDGHGQKGGLWPEAPDGDGPSLELIQPHLDWYRPWYWAPSRVPGGTPGRENSRNEPRATGGKPTAKSPSRGLHLNEARLESEGAFVEILNDGEAQEKLDGLKLTCGPLGEGGVTLSGTLVKGKLHVVTAEALAPILAQLGQGQGKAKGRRLFLLTSDGLEIIDSVAARRGVPPGASFGRFPDGTGGISTCAKATPGAPNPAPAVSDVVIHEIHYNSASGDEKEEFVEIHNRGKSAVPIEGWKLERAVAFEFPDGASIKPGGFAIVASDPEKVRARVTAGAGDVFGPWKGKLSNSGDVVILSNASGDEADRVEYADRAPWPAEADGGGFSIELIDPALDNRWPEAWTTGGAEGTPCQKGARAIKTMPPAIGGVVHSPAVPGPEDGVIIHAHVVDTGSISSVLVVYRELNSRSAPVKKAMADGGKLEDGAARDGHYTVRLPRFRAGTLIGYAIHARDGSGRETRAPAEPTREFLLQVEDQRAGPSPAAGMPVYRILMAPEAWNQFAGGRQGRETRLPCTFIASIEGPGVNERKGEVFHEALIRHRGSTSFQDAEGHYSYRLFLEGGKRYDGRDRLILSAYDSFRQKAAVDVIRMAGLPTTNADVIRLKTPTSDDSRYLDIEVINNEFLDDKLGSSAGRLFRGMNGADLTDHGADAANYLAAYVPVNRKEDSDIRSLLKLIQVLDSKDPNAYADQVEKVVDPAEWAMYFAVNHLVGNNERSLNTGLGGDFFLAERPSDGKYILVPWDQNETFWPGLTNLRPFQLRWGRLRVVTRFLEHPRFAPLYHRALRELMDGPFSRASFERWKAYHGDTFRMQDVMALEQFVEMRQGFLRVLYPVAPRAGVQPEGESSRSGFGTRTFLASAGDSVLIQGLADPAVAFQVKVAGAEAEYDPVRGLWSWRGEQSLFVAGPNVLWVEAIGPLAETADAYPINVERVASFQRASGSMDGKDEWTKEKGPVLLEGNVTIPAGSSLRIGPGVDVICAPGSSMTVRGALQVEGTLLEPVTFRPADRQGSWLGLRFLRGGSPKGSSLAHCRFEGGQAGARIDAGDDEVPLPPRGGGGVERQGVGAGFLRVEGAKVLLDHCVFRAIQGPALLVADGELEARGLVVSACETGLISRGGTIRVEGPVLSDLLSDGMLVSRPQGECAIHGAVVRDVQGRGLAIEGGKVVVEGALVHGCARGIEVSGGAKARISRTTLAGNAKNLVVDPPRVLLRSAPRRPVPIGPGRPPPPSPETGVVTVAAESTSDVDADGCVFGPGLEHIAAGEDSHVSISRTLFAPLPGFSPRGEGVIVGSPKFTAAHRGDFRLLKGSPGQGKGPGGADLGWTGGPSSR